MTTRYHSQSLDLPVKLDTETGIVTVKDLQIKKVVNKKPVYKNSYVTYTHDECEIIRKNMGEIDRTVHNVKKIFGGELINYTGTRPETVPQVITETGIIEPGQFDLF